VDICDTNRNIIAKGLSNYSQAELELIKGKSTKEIEKMMGYKYMDEAVHRDNIIVF
jgi:glutamate 5-kinase